MNALQSFLLKTWQPVAALQPSRHKTLIKKYIQQNLILYTRDKTRHNMHGSTQQS